MADPYPVVTVMTGSQPAPAPQNRVMDQIDRSFVPHVLVIHRGDKVLFPNSDNIRHHVYSFSEARPFELKLYSGKPEAPVDFNQAGLVVLGCNIHDQMLGYIYVTDAPVFGVTDAQGQVTLDVPADSHDIRVWHERYSADQTAVLTVSRSRLEQNGWLLQVPLAVAPAAAMSEEHQGFGNKMRH